MAKRRNVKAKPSKKGANAILVAIVAVVVGYIALTSNGSKPVSRVLGARSTFKKSSTACARGIIKVLSEAAHPRL